MEAHHSTPMQPKTNIRWRVTLPSILILAALILAGIVTAASAGGVIIYRWRVANFDPEGSLSADGRQVSVSGPYLCEGSETANGDIQVSLVQPFSGAFANGSTRVPCTGEETDFTVEVTVPEERAGFVQGQIQACAVGQIVLDNGPSIGEFPQGLAKYWCAFVTLSRLEPIQ